MPLPRSGVTPGRRSGLVSELLDGLGAGDIIITHPGERVADGTRVRVEG